MTTAKKTKLNVEQLIKHISSDYEALSKQLKVIARHVEQHRDHIGLDGIQEVARAGSAVERTVYRYDSADRLTGTSLTPPVGLTQSTLRRT